MTTNKFTRGFKRQTTALFSFISEALTCNCIKEIQYQGKWGLSWFKADYNWTRWTSLPFVQQLLTVIEAFIFKTHSNESVQSLRRYLYLYNMLPVVHLKRNNKKTIKEYWMKKVKVIIKLFTTLYRVSYRFGHSEGVRPLTDAVNRSFVDSVVKWNGVDNKWFPFGVAWCSYCLAALTKATETCI